MCHRLFRRHLRRAAAVHHFADHRQQRHFPHDHFAPRPGDADVQLAVTVLDDHLLRIVAKRPQPVQIILTEEGQAREISEFGVGQRQPAHQRHLGADLVGIFAQQFVAAAAEFRRHADRGIAMEHCLLHMKLISIGIKQ